MLTNSKQLVWVCQWSDCVLWLEEYLNTATWCRTLTFNLWKEISWGCTSVLNGSRDTIQWYCDVITSSGVNNFFSSLYEILRTLDVDLWEGVDFIFSNSSSDHINSHALMSYCCYSNSSFMTDWKKVCVGVNTWC